MEVGKGKFVHKPNIKITDKVKGREHGEETFVERERFGCISQRRKNDYNI